MTQPPPFEPEVDKDAAVVKKTGIASWWNQFARAISFSLQRLWVYPVATWITLITIGLAFSLPVGMHILLKNLHTLTDDERQIPTVSVFLKQDVTLQQAKDRAELFRELPQVNKVDVKSREDAMEEFSSVSGFTETMKTLGDNLLPHVIIVTPKLDFSSANMDDHVKDLSQSLGSYPEVDSVQADIEWVQRLQEIMSIANRVLWVIGSLLALTILLVVGNTIRLDIENRRKEIDVARFIGATHAYIRRPFLLGGFWLGLFGGIMSLVIVHIAMLPMLPAVQRLSNHYGSQFTLSGLDFQMTFYILIVSGALGLIGAWFTVNRHLNRRELSL